VTQINTLPTINTALSVVAALAAGLYADRTGQFWVPSIFASLGVFIGCVPLTVWNVGEMGRVAAFIITGTNGGTFQSLSSLNRPSILGTNMEHSSESRDNVLGNYFNVQRRGRACHRDDQHERHWPSYFRVVPAIGVSCNCRTELS
jgi:hypothetical protein